MNVVVFDTETAGCKTQTLLNVGYKVIDLNPTTAEVKELIKRDYIVRSVIENELFMLNDMFVGIDKLNKMRENLANKGTVTRSVKQIFSQMQADILRYKCIAGYAYNSNFDTDKFEKTANQYGIENPLSGLPIIDLWGMAFQFICNKPEYLDFCKENQMLTESKRFWKTSVEGVIAYLTNNPLFEEEHTALSDVAWETQILQECIKRGANPFGHYEHGFLPSLHVFEKTLTVNGQTQKIRYTKMTKAWDKAENITFINEVGE